MYNRILIPTDGSPPAKVAVDHAIELAAIHDAEVHTLFCVEPIPLGKIPAGTRAASADYGEVLERLREAGHHVVDEVTEQATDAGVDVVGDVIHGHPGDEIIDYVDDHGIDLVVMGTKGRTGAERFVLGSVAEKVVRRCPVPVLTVREPSP